jgi:hypothetical protein
MSTDTAISGVVFRSKFADARAAAIGIQAALTDRGRSAGATAAANATAAAASAAAAEAAAATATTFINDTTNDDKFTPAEKTGILTLLRDLYYAKSDILAQAAPWVLTGQPATYTAAFNAFFVTYLPSAPVSLQLAISGNNEATWGTTTTDLGTSGGATFRTNMKTYFDARQAILSAIAVKAQAVAAQASSDASAANTNASNALTLAGSKTKAFYQASAPTNPASPNQLNDGDMWFSTDTTTTCPDSACLGRNTTGAGGGLISGVGPHRYTYVPHRWSSSGSAWKGDVSNKLIIASEIAAGAIVADKIAANVFQTSNYTNSGTVGTSGEVALTGAKMQTAAGGTALLVAAGNLKVGTVVFDHLLRVYHALIPPGDPVATVSFSPIVEPDLNYSLLVTPTDIRAGQCGAYVTKDYTGFTITATLNLDGGTGGVGGSGANFDVAVIRLP